VAIVAIVAIGFLVSESGQVSNLTGDAYRSKSISYINPYISPPPTYTPPPTIERSTCKDSDGGVSLSESLTIPGTVKDGTATYNDRCVISMSGMYLEEWYCSGNSPSTYRSSCPCVTTNGIGHC